MTSDRDLILHDDPTGRREAFDEIVALHGPMVYGVALRVLRDHHHAEDVVQLTFIELAKQPKASGPHLVGWLHGTAMNVARKLLRSRVRSDRREAARGSTMVATRSNDAGELREEIDAALGRLPADLREAVILHYLENRGYEESSRLSGCSEDALRKRTQRGLSRLHALLAGRGIACGLDPLAAFLVGESAVKFVMPTGLLGNVSEHCHGLLQGQAASTVPKTAIKEVLRIKMSGAVAAAVLVGGALAFVGVRELARRWTAPASAAENDAAGDRPSPGWTAADRARFRALSLRDVATVASSRPIFRTESHGTDGLIPPYWGEFRARGIPFRIDDPQDGSVRNVIVLQSRRGDLSRQYPRSVSVHCGVSARAIHLLSGVSGWGFPSRFPRERGKTVTMIVRLKYAGGEAEDHPLLDGVHFTYYYTLDDVPASKRAIVLKGSHQVRHLVITPGRTAPIEQIEFLDGQDDTAPVVMAVTVEIAGKGRG
jgi:RNA polymerase sigma factor (sigma-70 family)